MGSVLDPIGIRDLANLEVVLNRLLPGEWPLLDSDRLDTFGEAKPYL